MGGYSALRVAQQIYGLIPVDTIIGSIYWDIWTKSLVLLAVC